jgi:hypothetical protein
MVNFKTYILEYFKGNPITNPKMSNTKDPNRAHLRKNVAQKVVNHQHKHSLVASVADGKANNVSVAGMPLINLLNTYDTLFEPGIKTLANSNVEIEMNQDEKGNKYGIVRRKK